MSEEAEGWASQQADEMERQLDRINLELAAYRNLYRVGLPGSPLGAREDRPLPPEDVQRRVALLEAERELLLTLLMPEPVKAAVKPIVWLGKWPELRQNILSLFKNRMIQAETKTHALRLVTQHFVGKDGKRFRAGQAVNTTEPIVWCGTARAWGDMILKAYDSGSIEASSRMNALELAGKHFLWKDPDNSQKPARAFKPRSVDQSCKNRDEYQDARKTGPR